MKVDHINIVVEDIVKSEEFYLTLLGLKKTQELYLDNHWMGEITGFDTPKAKCVFLETPDKSCRIELLEYITPQTATDSVKDQYKLNHVGIRHIAFEVDNIYEIHEKALKKGIKFISKPIQVPLEVVPTGKILCYLQAPDGVILELAQYSNKGI